MLKALWEFMNGKKFSTGTIITLAALVLRSLGMNETDAMNTVTLIMGGIGGVTALIGAIHQWIKVGKKPEVKPQ